MTADLPENETERLAVLREHRILDTPPGEEFDDLVRLAAHICDVPISAVSLIDTDRQWFKSIYGLDLQETSRDSAFCAHTLLGPELMVVPDAQADPRFADNPLVTGDPHIRFYAGAPLVTEDGYALGSLCVIDRVPRQLTPAQQSALRALGRQASALLEMGRRLAHQERLGAEQERFIAERDAALAESQRLAAIVASSEDAIYSKTLDGTITSWNMGAERLYGYSAAEMIGQPVDILAPPDCRDELARIMTAIRSGERIAPLETERLTRTSARVDVSLRVSLVTDAGGRVVGASMIARDITARKKVERALAETHSARAETEALFRTSVSAMEEGMVLQGEDAAILMCNESAERILGLTADQMAGRTSLDPRWRAVREDGSDFSGEQHPAMVALREGTPQLNVIMGIHKPSGERTWVSVNAVPLAHAGEQNISERSVTGQAARGVVVTLVDITERLRQEQALRDSAERLRQSEAGLRAILESAPVILYAADTEGTVTLSEGTGLTALGLKPGEAVGRSVFEFSGGDPEREDPTRRALAGESVSYDAEAYGLCLHTELQPVRDGAGAVTGIIGVCFDVTERARAEERFRVLFEQSSEAHLLLGAGGIIDCNPATVALLRCRDIAQMLSLHPAVLSPEFQPDGRRSDEKCVEMDALAHERGCHRFEWMHRKMDGEDFPVEVTLTPVALEGQPVLLVAWHDLTERKRQEERIRDYNTVLEFQKQELEKANAELAALATTDGLTGLNNHRAFQERLADEAARAVRYGTPLSLILLDVDRFKQYNDTFGHPEGDAVLEAVARTLQAGARDTDLVARYGGEEFVLVLPQTDMEGAMALAERLRVALESCHWPLRAVSASFGVAEILLGEQSTGLLSRADDALYQSKILGRNRVTCASATKAHSGPLLTRCAVRSRP